jgi:hypothetical protein
MPLKVRNYKYVLLQVRKSSSRKTWRFFQYNGTERTQQSKTRHFTAEPCIFAASEQSHLRVSLLRSRWVRASIPGPGIWDLGSIVQTLSWVREPAAAG